MTTTLRPEYGSAFSLNFGTGLNSLPNSASGAYQSDPVDNSTLLADDYLIGGFFKTAAGALGTNPAVNIYISASFDGVNFGGSYGSMVVGTGYGGYTLEGNSSDIQILKVKPINAASESGQFNGVSLASLFYGNCPKKFVAIVNNQAGPTLDSTLPGVINATPVNWQQV